MPSGLSGGRSRGAADLLFEDAEIHGVHVVRQDFTLRNRRGLRLECSHWQFGRSDVPVPCVVYLHGNSGCRVEAQTSNLVPQPAGLGEPGQVYMLLTAGFTVFAFDFGGSGQSEGEYISLGWLAAGRVSGRAGGQVGAGGLGYSAGLPAELPQRVQHRDLGGPRPPGRLEPGRQGRSMGAVTALMHAYRYAAPTARVLSCLQ